MNDFVPGGAGSLSFELMHLNGVSCTIVDPRRPCFKRAVGLLLHIRIHGSVTPTATAILVSLFLYIDCLYYTRTRSDSKVCDYADSGGRTPAGTGAERDR